MKEHKFCKSLSGMGYLKIKQNYDLVLLAEIENGKFLVVSGFNSNNATWETADYYSDIDSALTDFNKIIAPADKLSF